MIINYCNCSGLMATCDKADSPADQRICTFSVPASIINQSKDQYCVCLRKSFDYHCDSANAQWHAKHGKIEEEVVPLTEEEVFDIRNRNTYPTH